MSKKAARKKHNLPELIGILISNAGKSLLNFRELRKKGEGNESLDQGAAGTSSNARGFARDSQELTAFFGGILNSRNLIRGSSSIGVLAPNTLHPKFLEHITSNTTTWLNASSRSKSTSKRSSQEIWLSTRGIAQAFTKLLHSYDLHWSMCEHGLPSGVSKSSPFHHVPNKKNRYLFTPSDMEKFRQFLDGPNKA